MPFPITLGELVTYSQQLANATIGGDQIDPTEWKAHVSTYYGRLHTTVADTGARCFETEVTLNLAALSLPSDHRSTIGVDLVVDSAGRRRQLAELMVQERGLLLGVTGSEAAAWCLSGTVLQLFPTPTTGTYKHLYVPQPTRYNTSADSTSIDVVTSDGLESIGWGVASVALHRSESMQQRAIDEHKAALVRLKEWAVQRSQAMPKRQIVQGLGRRSNINGLWNPASWRYR